VIEYFYWPLAAAALLALAWAVIAAVGALRVQPLPEIRHA
jgi:hypothetical protein